MLACPRSGFVMLSMPKTASTALVRAVRPYADIALSGTPKLKHVPCGPFHKRIAPLLDWAGYPRDSYELVSLFREPVAWLESWWRYRSRPRLRAADPERFAGEQTFEEYALDYLRGGPGSRGRPARFVSMGSGREVGVDRLLQYERPEVWQGWLSEKVGEELEFEQHKAIHKKARQDPALTPGTRAALEEHFAPEYDIYRHLLEGDGQWAPPKGYVAGSRS